MLFGQDGEKSIVIKTRTGCSMFFIQLRTSRQFGMSRVQFFQEERSELISQVLPRASSGALSRVFLGVSSQTHSNS